MPVDESLYELLWNLDAENYNPTSASNRISDILSAGGVRLIRGSLSEINGPKIQPGHSNGKTGLALSCAESPDRPQIRGRYPNADISFLQEKIAETSFDALVSIGPHKIVTAIEDTGHHYVTTETSLNVSEFNCMSYLEMEDCENIFKNFMNSGVSNQEISSHDTSQRYLNDY